MKFKNDWFYDAVYLAHYYCFSTSYFKFPLKRWSLTSNITPTPTSDLDCTSRLTYFKIFS